MAVVTMAGYTCDGDAYLRAVELPPALGLAPSLLTAYLLLPTHYHLPTHLQAASPGSPRGDKSSPFEDGGAGRASSEGGGYSLCLG